jgi:hypothetical protein
MNALKTASDMFHNDNALHVFVIDENTFEVDGDNNGTAGRVKIKITRPYDEVPTDTGYANIIERISIEYIRREMRL